MLTHTNTYIIYITQKNNNNDTKYVPRRTTQVIFIHFDIVLLPLTHCFLISKIPL